MKINNYSLKEKTIYIFDECTCKSRNLMYGFLSKRLVLANPGRVVMNKLHASKVTELIGPDKIFLTVAEAVQICSPKLATRM